MIEKITRYGKRFFPAVRRAYFSSWYNSLSERDRIQTAICENISYIDSAQVAFDRGRGFLEFDDEFRGMAIEAFELAITLDTTGEYKDKAEKYLALLSQNSCSLKNKV